MNGWKDLKVWRTGFVDNAFSECPSIVTCVEVKDQTH